MTRVRLLPAPAVGGAPPIANQAWADRLLALYSAARRAAATADRERPEGRNVKGHIVKAFDLAVDEAVRQCLEHLGLPLVVESEEGDRRAVGRDRPEWRVIVDPVDGSDNWSRGLPLSAFSCAVMPVDEDIRPECVVAAIVGQLENEVPWIACAGRGAWSGVHRLQTSNVGEIGEAVVSVELNHWAPSLALAKVLASARGVRSYGCASMALAHVASGALDAHIDLRDRLTAESYLAGARLVIDAGGCVVGTDGQPIAPVSRLTDRRSIVAGATHQLVGQILNALRDVEA